MLSNVHIVEDDGGNIKVSKGKSHQKVDGVVSAIMAIGNMMRVGANASAYENRGILTL
jgi:phage terminase large subunit-like protein